MNDTGVEPREDVSAVPRSQERFGSKAYDPARGQRHEKTRRIHLEGASVVEVARRLGYSRRHVTRLHRAAIERLRSVVE